MVSEQRSVAITGATGMVGSALASSLAADGVAVLPMPRGRQQTAGEGVCWDPEGAGVCEPSRLSGVDTIVHLAGENIAAGRWTATQKQRIRDSRVKATRNLIGSLKGIDQPPSTFVCASAIGIYGDRQSEELTESSAAGDGFLADVCREWEQAASEAAELGMRVVQVRIGVIISTQGGALAKMLTPFKLGLGGIVGNGQQYWSWVSLPDVVGILKEAIHNSSLSGPVNAVSPQPLTNRDFTKVLGRVLGRPTLFPLPSFMASLLLGEMAQELLLSSARVIPQVLNDSRYNFQHGDLESCLRDALG